MSERTLTTIIQFYATAPRFFNKVLFLLQRCLPAITYVSLPHKNLWQQDGFHCMTFKQSPNHKTVLSVLGSLHAFLVSPEELPGESCCRHLTFFQASVPIFTPKDGGSNLVLLWTSILLLIHQQMAVENSLPTYLETKGLTNDPNNNKGRKNFQTFAAQVFHI